MYVSLYPDMYMYQLERNGTAVTILCVTNIQHADIIWYIGDNRSAADHYSVNGGFVTASTTIHVTDSITVVCIGRNRSASENDTLTLHPLEG